MDAENAVEETYIHEKSDKKRPTYTAKETYLYAKRDLLIRQKRPTEISKPEKFDAENAVEDSEEEEERHDLGDLRKRAHEGVDKRLHPLDSVCSACLFVYIICNINDINLNDID